MSTTPPPPHDSDSSVPPTPSTSHSLGEWPSRVSVRGFRTLLLPTMPRRVPTRQHTPLFSLRIPCALRSPCKALPEDAPSAVACTRHDPGSSPSVARASCLSRFGWRERTGWRVYNLAVTMFRRMHFAFVRIGCGAGRWDSDHVGGYARHIQKSIVFGYGADSLLHRCHWAIHAPTRS
ncbi:hypothetical protein OH76DRAFT_1237379 [Lentinus brumalis]|uniref:Uncharacterized protein n=1 Tax=Lentinus brumalis TaxID=2498619 RepID=A0A371CSE9_9APHY|nr:hypothetical protein OH76DRAFT_1237379 [Polyporus brumalis]